MSELFVNKDKVVKGGEDFLQETYDTTMNSLNTAFGLATALAWTEAIKSVIQNVLPKGTNHYHLVYYALFVTMLYAAFLMLTKRSKKEPTLMLAKMA